MYIYTKSFEVPTKETKIVKTIPSNYPSVLNFGDIMFDRGVRNIIEKRGRDPFEYIKRDNDLIKNYDIIVANLEGPIIEMDRNLCQQKAYNFQFASTTPALLKSVGINMVTIANNHNYDCFSVGFESTKKFLISAGIDYMGDNVLEKSYVVKTVDRKRIAFVGIDQSVGYIQVSNFYPLIKKLDLENDYVVVNIHWGNEYELGFTETQETIAHALVDNGVDVVFGSHPHVVEPAEIYKNKAIFYSLGNFVFDQDPGETSRGVGVGVEFMEDKSLFTIFPFNINKFAPEFMVGKEKDDYCSEFLKSIKHAGCSFEL